MVKIDCEEKPEKEIACKNLHFFEGVHSASSDIATKLRSVLRKEKDLPEYEDLPEDFKVYLESMIEGSQRHKELSKEYFTNQWLDLIREEGKEFLEVKKSRAKG